MSELFFGECCDKVNHFVLPNCDAEKLPGASLHASAECDFRIMFIFFSCNPEHDSIKMKGFETTITLFWSML